MVKISKMTNSRARDVIFGIRSNLLLFVLHMLHKIFRLLILTWLLCLFFVLKEINNSEAGQHLGLFTLEGPRDEHFIWWSNNICPKLTC